MNNEQNFYDILRSKFNEREAPFDEENWKSMRGMIDTSRDAKRRVLWLVASLAMLLCIGGAVAVYSWTNQSGKSNVSYSTTSTSTGNSSNSSKTAVNGKQISNSETPAETANTAKIASINGQSATLNNASIGNSPNSANGIVHSQTAINGTASVYKKNRRNNTYFSKTGSGKIASNNSISSNKEDYLSKNPQIAGNNTTITNVTKTQSVNPVATSQKAPFVSSSLTAKAKASAAKATSHIADSATAGAMLPQRFSDEPRIFRGTTNLLFVEIGTQYSGGWQIGSVVQGRGFNPVVGIGYEHYMGSRWFLKTGIQFSTFGNMSPLTYNYQHSVGKVIYDSVITTKRLYFLRIPVQAEYFVGRKKRSSIGMGGSVWFLLGNTGYATTYQQVDNNPPVNVVQYAQNAPLSGYSKVDGSAYGLYRYMLSRKFSIYGIVYFEFTNMKNNSFFGENIIEKTKGGQVMLSYNLN